MLIFNCYTKNWEKFVPQKSAKFSLIRNYLPEDGPLVGEGGDNGGEGAEYRPKRWKMARHKYTINKSRFIFH